MCTWVVKISMCSWYGLRHALLTPTFQKLNLCAGSPYPSRRWSDRVGQGPWVGWANEILLLRNLNWWTELQFPSVVGTALVARKMKSGDRGGERQRGKQGERTGTEWGREISSKETPLSRTTKTQLETFMALQVPGNFQDWLDFPPCRSQDSLGQTN